MRELWRRVWFLLNRARFERELREEMEAHRAMVADAGGAPFGNTLRLRDEAVDAWGWRWLDYAVQDLRFGARLLWRSPAFTLTAIAVLALGVGVNLAAFQMFDRLALSPRPVRDPATLVNLYRRSPSSTSTAFSYPAFDFYRRHATRLTAAMGLVSADVTLGDESRHVPAEFVTANYFGEMGATPVQGRLLDAGDDRQDAPPVFAMSEDVWRASFGADPAIVGRVLHVNGQPFTVTGIVPRTFVGLNDRPPAIWIPLTRHPSAFPGSTLLEDWSGHSIQFYGRVAPGETAPAEAELRGAADALREQRPADVWKDEWLEIHDAGRLISFDEAAVGFALVGSLVGLLLLAACMNLGLLVLARALLRDREFGIRLAVGATRKRLARQLLTEHALLGLLGAAAGCIVAVQTSALIFRITGTPAGIQPDFNLRTVFAAACLAVVSALAFGFAPVWQTLRPAVGKRAPTRSVLLGAQVMAASALLIISGLLVRGVTRVVSVPLGFDYHHTLSADPSLVSHGTSPEAAAGYWRRVVARLRGLAGVRNVAVSTLPPLGKKVAVTADRTVLYDVTPTYFDTMQIRVTRGRIFGEGERGVVVISESLAKRRWPGADPLGERYDEATVVGVVNDARTVRLSESGATECYRPIEPKDMAGAVLVIRVDGSPAAAAGAIRSILQSEDSRLTPEVTALEDLMSTKLAGQRQAMQMVTVIGVSALLLAVIGLAGMVAFTVSERRREIGVRLALGASPAHVVRAVLGEFRVPLAAGAAAGSILAAIGGFVLSAELYGVSSFDPLAHLGAFALFGLVTSVAVIPSLRRAIRVDPVHTLRHE